MEALAKLGIDPWGIVLYIATYGVLIAVLGRFLYKPLLKYLDERRDIIKSNLQEAEELRGQLTTETAKVKVASEAAMAEAREKINEAQRFAKESAKSLLADADTRREKMLADAATQVAEMKAGLLDDATAEMKTRIERIVLGVIKNAVPKDAIKKSVEESVNNYSA